MNRLVGQWLELAEEDLRMASLAVEQGIPRQACFHSQQAAEKALKAYLLAESGTYPKSHSLEQLLLFHRGDELRDWMTRLRTLDQFYLPTRYADALPEGAAGELTDDDARSALNVARDFVADVRQRMTRQQ